MKQLKTFFLRLPLLWIVVFFMPETLNAESVSSSANSRQDMSGITHANKDVEISMQVSGRITRIFHREGSRVERGDVILHLDNRLELLEVEQRELILKTGQNLLEPKSGNIS